MRNKTQSKDKTIALLSEKATSISALSSNADKKPKHGTLSEVPSVRLAPEQIEEIHADEYSLALFYATRVQPLNMKEIKRDFPEPAANKAQAVMDRFLKAELVHIDKSGRYYSNFPENYINYSHYRYDGDLEAKKDSKVFQLMKENTGIREYWKDKTYFSIDSFYTEEQTKELLEMFNSIKQKAKHFSNENVKKKSVKGLKFRRIKFFDMFFALALVFFMSGYGSTSHAGNDPITKVIYENPTEAIQLLHLAGVGGGNDPSRVSNVSYTGTNGRQLGGGGHDPSNPDNGGSGGGGHDPVRVSRECVLEINEEPILTTPQVCELKRVADIVKACEKNYRKGCPEAEARMEKLIYGVQKTFSN